MICGIQADRIDVVIIMSVSRQIAQQINFTRKMNKGNENKNHKFKLKKIRLIPILN